MGVDRGDLNFKGSVALVAGCLTILAAALAFPATAGASLAQEVYVKASNTGVSDGFGGSIAISGNTMVVGALGEDSNVTGVNGNGANESASGLSCARPGSHSRAQFARN